MARLNDPEEIRRLLAETEVWAVVGLGDHPDRPAYGVARFLQEHGKRIVPVHPDAATVHGERGYPSLADIPFDVDVVDVFRRSDAAGAVADAALERPEVRGVWFQLGVVDHAAAERVLAAGRTMVMDRCPAIEWPKLLG
ncbi:CoA-binding protein [Thermobifida cellulosilytica]|jgi:Predicted CoA-binding protein|uniref:CoA-binding protein n=1 Tax=Thermobifida cellulosilytica TB100 TaxID=665004 RepID=A0A147KGC9_THECS|nr:CoA-binding protein [Thermobifida cellulosilytica]KUP96259.1 CoA-binding protein [Thermobifida cellulosilytica TB100]